MRKFTLAVLALCLFSATAFAQGGQGSIVGTVAGPDGNIAGATVTAKDNQTGKEQTVQASGEGNFSFQSVEVGTYTVTVTAPGFKTRVLTDVKVDAGRPYSLNAMLEIGNISETVEVVAGADVVNATNAELSNTVTPRQVKELPINGRNPLSLLNLIAGSNPTSSSINGQRTSSVNYTRDGLNVQDNFIRNGFVSDQPTVDDTGEFTVITQNAGAEYGTGSTQVVLVTPRGGSDFHGNVFEFNRNSKFAANNFFNNWNNVPRAFLNRNQFGGTLSGPSVLPHFGEGGPRLEHGKAFFFANYEGFRLANQVPITTTTLLPAARGGNFTYVDNTGVQRTVNVLSGSGLTLTGASLTTFNNAGGAIGVDPLVQSRFLSLLPNGGNGAFTGINFLQAYSFQRGNPETRNAVTGRFDVDFNDKNSANFVYKYNKNADARTDIAAGFSPNTFNTQGGPTILYVGAYRMSPTTSLTNEIRGGYQRSEPFFNSTTDPRSLPFLITPPLVTNPEPSFQSQGRNTDYWNIQDNATWTHGNHAFRFGGVGQYYRIEAVNFAGVTPTYAFGTTGNTSTPGFNANLFPGGINATDLARANSLRYFLGGIVGGGSQTANAVSSTSGYIAGAPAIRLLNFDNYGFYVSDQWRLSDKLTVNLGLRYELYTPLNNPDKLYLEPKIESGQSLIQTLANPNGQFQVIGGNAGNPGDFFKADKNNFGPNISVAYTPNFHNSFLGGIFPGEGKTVIRGGYRVNYVNDEYVRAPDNANLNNVGLGSTTAFARAGGVITGSTQFRSIGLGGAQIVAPVVTPASAFGPGGSGTRTFETNNLLAGGGGGGTLGGTISLIDPNIQVQRNYEYNFGIQREVGFQSVLEIRYVGGYSKELVRSIDYGQLRVANSGLLADFLIARENCRLQGLTIAGTGDPTQRCTDARFNPAIVGSRATPYLTSLEGAGFLNNNVILGPIRAGTPGALTETYVVNGIGITPGSGYNNLLVANPNGGVLNLTTNGGRYNYNSLQVEFRRRFTQGLSLQANYTFQKILTDVTGTQSESNQTRVEPYLDNNNPNRDYSRPAYDRTHTFNFNGLYELPFGRGKRWLSQGGAVDKIVGGFQFSSIVNISSGVPTSIIDTRGTLNRAGRSGLQPATSSLTETQIKELFGTFRTPNGVFVINPSVLFATATNSATGVTMSGVDLTQPLPAGFVLTSVRGANPVGTTPFSAQVFFPNAPGSTGNLTRNFLNGPIYVNWDAGLLKNINITENTRLQLRGEVFNVLNRANFFTADLDIGSTSFGRLTSSGNAYSPRIVQFGARFEF
ncbi:MAG: hypothetical protein QOH49_2757 [Acidobacteriota bacterium]|jgi:hypothetical protein|nr:hypothetical protein [Acidobacteriota bacterium]